MLEIYAKDQMLSLQTLKTFISIFESWHQVIDILYRIHANVAFMTNCNQVLQLAFFITFLYRVEITMKTIIKHIIKRNSCSTSL